MNCRTECSISKVLKLNLIAYKLRLIIVIIIIEKNLMNKNMFRQRKNFFDIKKEQNYASFVLNFEIKRKFFYNYTNNLCL